MGLIGQGGGGGPAPETTEQCKRDYEKNIEQLTDKARTTSRLHLAIMEYCEVIRPSLYKPEAFTLPQLIGHLILQERDLNNSRDALAAEWEKAKEMEG